MLQKTYSVSIIAPVYNEGEVLASGLSQIHKFMKEHFADFEIILIESGSTDGTGEKCDELTQRFMEVKVIHEGQRNGFGSALKEGYKASQKDLVWLVTVDMPFPLQSILNALPYFEKYDCVLSYRSEDNRNFYRKFQSFVYNTLVKIVLGLRVRHVNSAFKVYKRKTIQGMKLVSNGWFIDAEVLYWLRTKKIPYIEIPIPLVDRTVGQATVRASTFLSVLREMFQFIRSKESK